MTDSFHVIYLTGAPAAGKSTLVSLLMESVQPLEGLSYSKLLSDYIAQQRSQVDLAQMRKQSASLITPEDIDTVDTQLIEYVCRRRQETHLIIDSHPVTKEAYGFRITAFSIEKLQALRPTMICMLYTEPSVVVERIQANAQGRSTINYFEAAFHSELQGSVAATYGIVLGIPVYLLDSSKPVAEVANTIITRLEAKNPLTKRVDASMMSNAKEQESKKAIDKFVSNYPQTFHMHIRLFLFIYLTL